MVESVMIPHGTRGVSAFVPHPCLKRREGRAGHKLSHTPIPTAYTTIGLIVDRIERLARLIRSDYEGVTVHLLCVLKGGSAFFQDIVEALRAIHRLTTQVRSAPTICRLCSRWLFETRAIRMAFLCPHPY